ncbi:MAG: heavy-metal-associated domain-containing protein [Candidatus Izemoplasmatales bacterium]|nr:heavy-metal-associated domain-containing protein [Candidatus Izemoplasmatales bacterium]
MKKEIINVTGMKCDNCANTVTRVVSSMAGIDKVNVDLQGGLVTFIYDEDLINIKAIKTQIEKSGYKVG